jgi:hypothetical protein
VIANKKFENDIKNKLELEKIQERYPDRKWVIGQKLAGFYIAEIVED